MGHTQRNGTKIPFLQTHVANCCNSGIEGLLTLTCVIWLMKTVGMVSLGTGYFHPEASAHGAVRHFPIFKHTTPKLPSSVTSRAGSEADDEATTTVSAPRCSSSSSNPSSKREGPPVEEVNSRNKRACTELSTGKNSGETSSISTNTPPSIVVEREHFPLFTDEEDCTSIGEGHAGESYSSTTCSSPIPWSEINLTTPIASNMSPQFSAFRHHDTTKDTSSLPSYRQGSSSSSSQAERGRHLARVLLDQARSKQTIKRRRVSFARPVRMSSDVESSASTSTSSSGENKDGHSTEHRPTSRHVLSKRNKVRASLLRRAVQSLRRRKDFVDNLFEIPSGEEKTSDDVSTLDSHCPNISAVTARNQAFGEWESYLPVPKVASPTSKATRSWKGLPESPPRITKFSLSTPNASPSRTSVTSASTSWSGTEQPIVIPVSGKERLTRNVDVKRTLKEPSNEESSWLLDGLSARTDRETMLNHLGFLPREGNKSKDPSRLSREAVLKTLETLDVVWQKAETTAHSNMHLPPVTPRSPPRPQHVQPGLPPVTPRSPRRHVHKDFGPKPTVSILGVTLVNYPQLVCDQVNHFRRNVLNISDAFYGVWAAVGSRSSPSFFSSRQ